MTLCHSVSLTKTILFIYNPGGAGREVRPSYFYFRRIHIFLILWVYNRMPGIFFVNPNDLVNFAS